MFPLTSPVSTATSYYRQAVEINPYYSDAWSNLGTILHTQGKLKESMNNYEKAIETNALNAGNLDKKPPLIIH